MTSDMVQVGTPAGRVSPQLAVALFIVLFASVVGVGLFGDDLADLGRRRAPSAPASPLAVASTAASARASAGLDATPHPTASPTPTPVCDPPVIEPLADRIARHPGSLVATTLESLVPPTEFDGQILLDGRGVMWSHGPGRLARLDSEGHAVQGWTVADDARFGASIVAPARDGGVWLVSDGTAEIAWFDGRRFRDIVPLPGATSSVAEAADGTLWAVINRDDATTSSHEPAHWDGVRWTPVCTNEPSDWYDSLAVDGLGNVWMLSYGETGPAAAWRFDGAEWTTYGPTLDGPLPRGAPQALTVAPDGAVWLSYPTALARVDAWSLTVHEAPEDVDLSGATSFVIDRAGVAWLAAGTRTQAPYTAVGVHVVRFDGQSWRQFDASDGLPAPLEDWWVVVTSLAVEPRGMVAFTPRGLYALDGDRWERIDRHVAPLDAVNAVVVSADEAWVTTTSDGLWHYRAGHWVRDNPPRFRGWPRSLVRGPGDTIAVATDRQVAIRRAGTWSVLVEAEGSLGPVGLAFAPDGVLWASIADSSDLATFEWTGQDWTRRQIEVDPPAVMAGAIAFDRDQSPWLIGFGYVPRSIRLVDGRWQAIVVGEGLEPTGQIAIGRDGTVWLPVWRTPNEVALGAFDGRTWRVVEMGDGVGYVTSIAAAPDGSLLVGSSEGLSRFDGEHWEPMIRTGYLDAVAVGPDGSILACGSPGIVRVHVVQR